MVDNWRWPSVEVFDHGFGGIDSQVMVNGGEEVAWPADSFDGIFATFVGGTDDPTRFNSTTGPDV